MFSVEGDCCFKILSLSVFVLILVSGVSSTEIESGFVQISSTGSVSENIGFRPDYVEFISAQQIESTSFEDRTSSNSNCPQNVNGWSEGSVVFDDSGVKKQFSIGMFRNSDSTNGHITASSDSDVIRNIYTGRNNGECGRLEVSISSVSSNGFDLDVQQVYNFNEVIRYKAYQFPDNMPFDVGMVEVGSSETGNIDVSGLGFQPANLHIRSGQQIKSRNSVNDYWRDPAGRSKGYATLDEDGNVIDQQSIGTASSSDSTNAHRSLASDDHILNTVYVDQDANVYGRLEGRISGAYSDGFNMNIEENTYGSSEIFLYRAWGSSYYEYDVGYKVIDSEGIKSFNTEYDGNNFEPDAIDIYAEQQISSINNEVVTPTNSGCNNAGGWSNGYYEADDDVEWSISTGRSSDSQNAHRIGSSTTYALNNLYSRQGGGDCGNFQGEVTAIDSNGFDIDFTFDSNFDSNYGEEMVYYRALNFKTAPPQIENVDLYNKSNGHAFGLQVNVSEGSNDIDECKVTAESDNGNQETYDATISQINTTHSMCIYEWVKYDDNSNWKSRHDSYNELLNLDIEINASDIDGLSSTRSVSNTFPNHRPEFKDIGFENYSKFHGFNVSALIQDPDAEIPTELISCEMTVYDGEGNDVKINPSVNDAVGSSSEGECKYNNVNKSMPSGKNSLGQGFEVKEPVSVEINVTDHHGKSVINSYQNTIPNNVPESNTPQPVNETFVSESEIEISSQVKDSEGDIINITVYNQTGNILYDEDGLHSGDTFDYDWKLPDSTEDYYWIVETEDYWGKTNSTYFFTKIIGQAYRSRIEPELNYSSIIMNVGSNNYVDVTLNNKINNEKNLTISLSGVKAEFLDGSKEKNLENFPKSSKRTLTAKINPEKPGEANLSILVQNNNLNLNTTEKIPVTVINSQNQGNREVPGIGFVQIILLSLVSTVLYFGVL